MFISPPPNAVFQQTVPDYLMKYPQIQTSVPRVNNLLQQLPVANEKNIFNEGKFELEARFGTISNDGKNLFQPGVTSDFMHRCLRYLETFEDWKMVKNWEETHDYYYELPPHPEDLRRQGILVRTSVAFKKNVEGKVEIIPEHICKQIRDKQDFKFIDNHKIGAISSPGMDVRVSLNFEEKIPPDNHGLNIPPRVQPKYVRIKNRKSFVYQPSHASVPIWSMDFTKSWSAETRSAAETKQKNRNTVYEIEVECLDPYMYMNDPRRDQFYLATSLMLKLRDLISIDTVNTEFHWEPVYRY